MRSSIVTDGKDSLVRFGITAVLNRWQHQQFNFQVKKGKLFYLQFNSPLRSSSILLENNLFFSR